MAGMFDDLVPNAAPSQAPAGGGMFDDLVPNVSRNSDVSTLGDVVKSGGIGVVKGAIGMAGMAGDLRSLASSATDKIGGYLGASPEGIQGFKNDVSTMANGSPLAAVVNAPTSADVRGAVESKAGPLYEPKTKAGQYAQTIGEFAPSVIGGPESLLSKVATRVVAPAVASEAAGQATEGTALEPYARFAGSLAGHHLAVGAQDARVPQAQVPTVDELHDAATQNYANARGYGVEIRPQPVARLADDIFSDLGTDGFRERNVPKTWAAIDELRNPVGRNVTVDDIESVRRVLNRAGSNPLEGAEREASRRAISAIDNYMASLDPAEVAVNPHYAGDVAREIGEARGNWAAMRRAQTIGEKLENADLQAAATGSGANINNATRQKIKSILTSPKARRGYSDEELGQMERIVRGTFAGNAGRLLGKLAPTGVVSGSLGLEIGSHLIGGPMGVGAVPIAGAIAKRIGDASTARQTQILDRMVRSRSPLGTQAPPAPPRIRVSPMSVGATGAVALNSANPDERARGGRVAGPRPKLPHKAVAYTDKSRIPGKHCSVCSMYRGDHDESACSIVRDPIYPGGWCRRFAAKKSASFKKGGRILQARKGPPIPGARKAPDGHWYVRDHTRPGKYLRVVM